MRVTSLHNSIPNTANSLASACVFNGAILSSVRVLLRTLQISHPDSLFLITSVICLLWRRPDHPNKSTTTSTISQTGRVQTKNEITAHRRNVVIVRHLDRFQLLLVLRSWPYIHPRSVDELLLAI